VVKSGPKPCNDEEVLSYGGNPIAEGFGRGVDQDSGSRFHGMGAGGEAAAENGCRKGNGRVRLPNGTGGKNRSGGNADECVQGIPARIHAGDFINHELQQYMKPAATMRPDEPK